MSNDRNYEIRYIQSGECNGECYLCGAQEGLAEGQCLTLSNGKHVYNCNQCAATTYTITPESVKKAKQQLKDENPNAEIIAYW